MLDPHRVRLATGAEYSAEHLLIATGARPSVPDIPGAEHGITSDDMFELETRPERLLIVGGGYIACEFAGIMNGLGTQVTQLVRRDQILHGFDDDLRDHLATAMRARGVVIEIEREVARIERTERGLRVTVDNGESHMADQVLFATGRDPNTAGLGLEALGVGIAGNGAIEVDDWSQTAVPSIYAVGDVTDRAALTPVAIREGHAFAETVFGGRPSRFDHALIPTAVFTQPELATLGLTEAEARAQGAVAVYRRRFRPMLHTLAGRDERMLMKLVVAAERRAGARRPHRRPRRGRDDPACRGRGRHGRHQGRLRPDPRGASDRRRGARHHARPGPYGVLTDRLRLEFRPRGVDMPSGAQG